MPRFVLLLLLSPLACAHTPAGSSPCGAVGDSCSAEGTTCSPAPIGTGWAHALSCQGGKWGELEIAPLPPPQPDPQPPPSASAIEPLPSASAAPSVPKGATTAPRF